MLGRNADLAGRAMAIIDGMDDGARRQRVAGDGKACDARRGDIIGACRERRMECVPRLPMADHDQRPARQARALAGEEMTER